MGCRTRAASIIWIIHQRRPRISCLFVDVLTMLLGNCISSIRHYTSNLHSNCWFSHINNKTTELFNEIQYHIIASSLILIECVRNPSREWEEKKHTRRMCAMCYADQTQPKTSFAAVALRTHRLDSYYYHEQCERVRRWGVGTKTETFPPTFSDLPHTAALCRLKMFECVQCAIAERERKLHIN